VVTANQSGQAAVAKAVEDSLSDGVIPRKDVDNLYLTVSVFLEWDASDKDKVYKYNYQATKQAINNAYKRSAKNRHISQKKLAYIILLDNTPPLLLQNGSRRSYKTLSLLFPPKHFSMN
jgi:hypothetical protein